MSARGQLRIAGGTLRGRRIRTPSGYATRPTASRVREAIFSMVGGVDGIAVLDLFAGSGALGFEAISRGASGVTFVDRAPRVAATVRANAEALGQADRCRIVARDYRVALAAEARAGRTYGLCLVDPPYSVTERIASASVGFLLAVLESGATVVVESAASSSPPLIDLPAAARDDRTYGDTAVSVIRLEHTR